MSRYALALLVATSGSVVCVAMEPPDVENPAAGGEFVLPTPDDVPVWHPRRTECVRHELADSDRRWTAKAEDGRYATSLSSLRFWRLRDHAADIVVFDSDHRAQPLEERHAFVLVASGRLNLNCAERQAPGACPAAAEVRSDLMSWRAPVGAGVDPRDEGLPIRLHATAYRVEAVDRFGVRNRWSVYPDHPDFDRLRVQFDRLDGCFARVRGALAEWAKAPEAPPPSL